MKIKEHFNNILYVLYSFFLNKREKQVLKPNMNIIQVWTIYRDKNKELEYGEYMLIWTPTL